MHITIVTCVTKPDVYETCLLKSIYVTKGHHIIDILPIHNKNRVYTAPVAFNIALESSKSDIIIFCHQDVRLLPGFFENLEQYIMLLPRWAIIGVAGISLSYGIDDIKPAGGSKHDTTIAVGKVWHTDNINNPPYWDGDNNLTPVHCVDEVLFVYNRQAGLKFDTMLLGFHGYGIDLSLEARHKQESVYAANLPIIHYGEHSSSITCDRSYWQSLLKLAYKWGQHFPILLGTFMHGKIDSKETSITSYIPMSLEDDSGIQIQISSIEIKNLKCSTDGLV